jgi:hypothetical protein
MANTNSDDAAFPVFSSYGQVRVAAGGLTKREYFAALAMQGLMAADADKVNRWSPRQIAQVSVDNAEALIDELNVEDRHG